MKVFVQNLVAEIRVEDRNMIRPTFRFPEDSGPAAARIPVRAPSGSVDLRGHFANRILGAAEQALLDLATFV